MSKRVFELLMQTFARATNCFMLTYWQLFALICFWSHDLSVLTGLELPISAQPFKLENPFRDCTVSASCKVMWVIRDGNEDVSEAELVLTFSTVPFLEFNDPYCFSRLLSTKHGVSSDFQRRPHFVFMPNYIINIKKYFIILNTIINAPARKLKMSFETYYYDFRYDDIPGLTLSFLLGSFRKKHTIFRWGEEGQNVHLIVLKWLTSFQDQTLIFIWIKHWNWNSFYFDAFCTVWNMDRYQFHFDLVP